MAEECFKSVVSESLASTINRLCSAEIRKKPNEPEFQQSSIQSCSPADDISADTEDTSVDLISISALNELNNELIDIENEYHPESETIQIRDIGDKNTAQLEHDTVGVFLETPVIDENNVCLTLSDYQKVAAKPKRISDDFFSSDDGDDEKQDCCDLQQRQENEILEHGLVNNHSDENSSENITQAASEFLEEDTSSSSSNLINISNVESRLLGPSASKKSVVKPVPRTGAANCGSSSLFPADISVFYGNDVQSIEAIERQDFVQEQKLIAGVILKNSSLDNCESRLNLEYLESYRQDIKKLASEHTETWNIFADNPEMAIGYTKFWLMGGVEQNTIFHYQCDI